KREDFRVVKGMKIYGYSRGGNAAIRIVNRLGALYLSYKGFRVGVNSEHVRHAIQNVIAHHLISPQGSFQNTSWNWRPYSQYQTSNPFEGNIFSNKIPIVPR